MSEIERLQSYLRYSAGQSYDVVAVPPFTLFFHPTDDFTFFNYAIPNDPSDSTAELRAPLAALSAAFLARRRHPRFEYIKEYAPGLAIALQAAGFVEESHTQLMLCDPAGYRPQPAGAGLEVAILTATSPLEDLRTLLTVRRRGFELQDAGEVTETRAEEFRDRLGNGRGFLARLDGRPVGAGSYSAPHDGLTELTGIATLQEARRRGVATAITSVAAGAAFAQGVQGIFLSAADEQAGRVYTRVGFQARAVMLAYSGPS